MDEQSERTALLSVLTTEHFVLQTANNSTYSEASARSTLYVMALSSALVAMGFVASSTSAPYWVGAVAGVAGALILTWLFYVYQRWRFADYDTRASQHAEGANGAL